MLRVYLLWALASGPGAALQSLVPRPRTRRAPPRPPTYATLREYEKKHGRVALLAAPALAVLQAVDPEPLTWWARQPWEVQGVSLCVAAALELGLSAPRLERPGKLKDSVVPGYFPPLPIPSDRGLARAEDRWGRAAMLAVVILAIGTS